MTCIASLLLKEGTLSHNFWSSFIAAGDRMSGLIDNACPSCKHRKVCQSICFMCQSLCSTGLLSSLSVCWGNLSTEYPDTLSSV